jgi:Glycosyl hydrolase family 12
MTWWLRTAFTRILLSGAIAATAVAVTAPVPATASLTEVSCNRWQALHVTGITGQPLVVRNKPSINNNDDGMCLSVQGSDGAFTVTRSPGTATSPTVRAYPYIGTGCFEGACSSAEQGVLPRAAALGNYTVRWATSTPPNSGKWDSSLDIWCGPRSGVGTYEIMIWLHYSGPQWWVHEYPKVWVDGAQWYEVPHTTAPGRHYISFRRASPVTSASLRLAPFMARAKQLGDIDSSALMWAVQAGFEIWSGGQGLAVTRFSATS